MSGRYRSQYISGVNISGRYRSQYISGVNISGGLYRY